MEQGFAEGDREWICFLGADDYFWDITVLDRIREQLELLPPNIRVLYGQNMIVSAKGEKFYPMGLPWATVKARFLAGTSLPHPGMMHHRSLFEQHGAFDESFRIAGDYEMLLRELKTAEAIFVLNLIIAGVRQGESAASRISPCAFCLRRGELNESMGRSSHLVF